MDTRKIRKYVIALSIVLAMDLVWLLIIAKSFYDSQLSGFARPEVVPVWSAALAWALIPLGIVFFVDKIARNRKESLAYGALYGFILYGLYEFTNYATLAQWTLSLVAVDILWGTFLCSVASLLTRILGEKWQA